MRVRGCQKWRRNGVEPHPGQGALVPVTVMRQLAEKARASVSESPPPSAPDTSRRAAVGVLGVHRRGT